MFKDTQTQDVLDYCKLKTLNDQQMLKTKGTVVSLENVLDSMWNEIEVTMIHLDIP